jgi:hypothetical protein
LLPVRALGKVANQRCKHQRHTGCMVYHKPGMPPECYLWNCRWLVNDDTGDLSRPDRSHYVIDIMPDFITAIDNTTGETRKMEVVQVWIDPKFPDAYKDPHLRAYLDRRGYEGKLGMIRFNEREAITLVPPSLAPDGEWHELGGQCVEKTHTAAEVIEALGGDGRIKFTLTEDDDHAEETDT